jgi:hypothetical protein
MINYSFMLPWSHASQNDIYVMYMQYILGLDVSRLSTKRPGRFVNKNFGAGRFEDGLLGSKGF